MPSVRADCNATGNSACSPPAKPSAVGKPNPNPTGPQTAIVTGPPGQKIWTNEYDVGFIYLQIEPRGVLWEHMLKHGGIGLHTAAEFPGLRVKLWGVR